MSEKFSQFLLGKTNKSLYIKQNWNFDSADKFLELILTDCSNYWSETYGKDDIQESSNLHDFDLETVKKHFENAFSMHSRADYLIELTDSSDMMHKKLRLKKMLEEEITVDIIRLSLKLCDDPEKFIGDIFKFSIDHIEKLEKDMKKLQNEHDLLASERAEAFAELENCVKQKDELETDLYSKFVLILNEKKKKIRELYEEKGE